MNNARNEKLNLFRPVEMKTNSGEDGGTGSLSRNVSWLRSLFN